MFVLYFILYFFIFVITLFIAMLFINFKILIDGEFQNKQLDGKITIYWIKFLFSISLSMKDKSNINVKIVFLQIPIKFSVSLKKDEKKIKPIKKENQTKLDSENKKSEKRTNKYNSISKIQTLYIEKKPQITFYKQLLTNNFLIIWRKYLRIKLVNLSTNIGLSDPSNTGKLSGYLYSLPLINNKKNINLQWDYVNARYDILVQTNIIMKLYGILFRLLVIWTEINKFKKMGAINDK